MPLGHTASDIYSFLYEAAFLSINKLYLGYIKRKNAITVAIDSLGGAIKRVITLHFFY